MTLPLNGPGVTVRAFKERSPIIVEDTGASEWKGVYVDPIKRMNSELAIPIVRNDRCLGVLNLESTYKGAFKPIHRELATRIANRASLTLDFSRSIDTVHKIARAASQARPLTLPEVLDTIYNGVEELFGRVESAIFLTSPSDSRKLVYSPGTTHQPKEYWAKLHAIEFGKGVVGRAAATRQMVHIRSVSQIDTDSGEYIPLIPNTQTSVGFPLLNPQDRVMGAFIVEASTPDAFSDLDIEILEVFAQFASIALSNHAFINDIEQARQREVNSAGLTALGEITGNLVHRIGNDIGAANQVLKQALQQPKLRPELDSQLTAAKKSCSDVLKLVNSLFHRIQDVGKLGPRELDVKKEVAVAIESIGEMPQGIQLKIAVPRNLGPVHSTEALHLVIEELVRNALKSFAAKPEGNIAIKARSEGNKVFLSVRNTGSPIPDASQAHIFNFLYQGVPKRKRPGIGFGLYWARAVLRAQGGDIGLAYSNKAKGTEFEIELHRAVRNF